MENKEIMKSKYLSRKFITAIGGLVVSTISICNDNTVVAIAGILLAGCFVIGESIVDAHAAIKREILVHDYRDSNVPTKEE